MCADWVDNDVLVGLSMRSVCTVHSVKWADSW